GNDYGTGLALDPSNNAYLSGYTASTNFPTVSGALQGAYGGGTYDAFAVKVNAQGTGKLYSTYLGGEGDDEAYAVAVSRGGEAYLTGKTDSTACPLASAYQSSKVGTDAFVSRLGAGGGSLVYSTYLGGSGTDQGYAIAVDAAGLASLTG